MTPFYQWLFWRLCSMRHTLDRLITWTRVKAGYKAGGRVARKVGEQ